MTSEHDPRTEEGERGGGDAVERLLQEARTLPLKGRLRLLDALRSDAILQQEDGVSFSLESLAEFKRARKRPQANRELEQWIAGFDANDVLFDVGANTGGVSLHTAHVHSGRVRVYAFEPASDTYAALVRNVQINGFGDAITPVQVALLDVTGIQRLHRSSLGAGTALHAVGEALDYARRPFAPVAVEQVVTLRVDDLVATLGVPMPTRLKLDVDGFEDKVLAGASRVLETSRCDVYVELVETVRDDPHPARVRALLEGFGYALAHVAEHRPPGVYPRIVDALFVRSDAATVPRPHA